jgi:hypothetical protein
VNSHDYVDICADKVCVYACCCCPFFHLHIVGSRCKCGARLCPGLCIALVCQLLVRQFLAPWTAARGDDTAALQCGSAAVANLLHSHQTSGIKSHLYLLLTAGSVAPKLRMAQAAQLAANLATSKHQKGLSGSSAQQGCGQTCKALAVSTVS